jgi:hypothetical protein
MTPSPTPPAPARPACVWSRAERVENVDHFGCQSCGARTRRFVRIVVRWSVLGWFCEECAAGLPESIASALASLSPRPVQRVDEIAPAVPPTADGGGEE